MPTRRELGLLAAGLVATDAAAAATPIKAKGTKMKSGRMRVYEVGDNKNGSTLHIVERPIPVPGPGEVVMRVRVTGLNARDLDVIRGGMNAGRGQPATRIPLSDNAGDIAAVGPGVTRVKVGDRVTMTHYWRWIDGAWDESMRVQDYANTLDGFLAEYVVVPAEPIIKIPDGMSYEDAATLQSAGLTAWNAVVAAGKVKPGDTVLTIGILNNVGLQELDNCLTASASGARIMHIGSNSVAPGRPAVGDAPAIKRFGNMITRDLTIKGIIVGSRRMFEDLIIAMHQHGIKPLIDRVYPFEQAREAIAYMESGDKLGKIMIRVA